MVKLKQGMIEDRAQPKRRCLSFLGGNQTQLRIWSRTAMGRCQSASGEGLARRRNLSIADRLRGVLRYRLIVPLKRRRHSPEYTARGVMIGLFWAFTPMVGIQMYLVSMTWGCSAGIRSPISVS
jgi:hypothetical protein